MKNRKKDKTVILNIMPTKRNCLQDHLTCLFKYAIFFLSIGCLLMVSTDSKAEAKKRTPKEAVEELVNAWKYRTDLINVKLTYCIGTDIHIIPEITESNIVKNGISMKVEVDSSYLRASRSGETIQEALKKFPFEHFDKKNKVLDLYLICQFYKEDKEKDKEQLRIVFAKSFPVVLINGEPYKLTLELLLSFFPLLPAEATQNIYEHTIDVWIYSQNRSLPEIKIDANETH
jgi:hypothetical protein